MAIEINGTTGISGVNGSATTPALQGSDTNTGLSFGTNELSLNTDGTERFRVGSAGQLGIGGATYGTSGQALISGGSSAAPSWGAVGKILQVVRSHDPDKSSTTSTTLTKLSTSTSITPSSTNSKIKITITTGIGNADTGNANFAIVRTVGGTDTTIFSNVANKYAATGSYQYDAFAWTDLDSPSTTSAVTYSISAYRQDGNATPFVGGRNTDTAYRMGVLFILEEVAA